MEEFEWGAFAFGFILGLCLGVGVVFTYIVMTSKHLKGFLNFNSK